MSLAMNSASIDPTVAKGDLLVLPLKGTHASAIDALRHDGYSRIVTHAKSLVGNDLRAALAEARVSAPMSTRCSRHPRPGSPASRAASSGIWRCWSCGCNSNVDAARQTE